MLVLSLRLIAIELWLVLGSDNCGLVNHPSLSLH